MTKDRKADHVDICLNKAVNANYNYWEDVHLVHRALPELDFDEIDTTVTLFNKELKAPIIIAAMTGGFKDDKYDAEVINGNLAAGAAAAGIGMGVGSQRRAIVEHENESTFTIVKEHDVPLVIGNIGAPQLVPQKDGRKPLTLDELKAALELIDADILAVHLNYLQEICMVDGEKNAHDCLDAIGGFAKELPILVKETGAGISNEMAIKLRDAGVAGFDVGGLSGTSFAAVEMHRAERAGDKLHQRLGSTLWNWGIPTPICILESNVGLPMIATGGLRTGLDVARTLVLGANAGGIAKNLLGAAVESSEAVTDLINIIINELKSTMFLLGAKTPADLAGCNYILTGTTMEWRKQRQGQLLGRF
jgi:isopentenyl-diphosphate delta-isomerase